MFESGPTIYTTRDGIRMTKAGIIVKAKFPQWLKDSQAKLARLQQKLSRMGPGSKDYQETIQKLRQKGIPQVARPVGRRLMRLIEHSQFDTIYHEHFHYLSLTIVQTIFRAHGLEIYNMEELVFTDVPSVSQLLMQEEKFGLKDIQTYTSFTKQMQEIKLDALQLFPDAAAF